MVVEAARIRQLPARAAGALAVGRDQVGGHRSCRIFAGRSRQTARHALRETGVITGDCCLELFADAGASAVARGGGAFPVIGMVVGVSQGGEGKAGEEGEGGEMHLE